jgi:hypothetical protein
MKLELIEQLPDDIINLIYAKIVYKLPNELLTDIRNFKKSKERLKEIHINDIISILCYLDYVMVKVPKIIKTEKYCMQFNSNKYMMLNLCLAKHDIGIRNRIVYDVLNDKIADITLY